MIIAALLLGQGQRSGESTTRSSATAVEGQATPTPESTDALPSEMTGESAVDGHGNRVPVGFPTADTTGVRSGTGLRSAAGDVMVRTDGTVIEGMDLEGCVVVRANDVIIRNSRIRCGGGAMTPFPVRIIDGFTGLLVEDTEIDGLNRAKVALIGSNWTARRIDVHSATDGLRMGTNTTVEDSYVHDLSRLPETHNDTVQTIGGNSIRIVGNTLLAYNQRTDDAMNGAIQTGRLHSPLVGMLVEGNYLDGGSYTVRGGSGPRDGHLITDYVFRDNLFGPNCMYGPVAGVGSPVTWEPNNRWADTGESIGLNSRANKLRCTQTP